MLFEVLREDQTACDRGLTLNKASLSNSRVILLNQMKLPHTFLLFVMPCPVFAAFSLIENFDTYALGSLTGQGGWTANTQWTVASAPVGGSGNVASGIGATGSGAAYRALNPAIDNANTATTLFFRLYRTGAVNISAGLSDDAVPALFGGYEVQLNAQNNGTPTDSFKIRDANAFEDLGAGTFAQSVWYNVWMVINTSTDTYEVWMNQGDYGTAGTPLLHIQDPVIVPPDTSGFTFRNGASANPLTTLIFAMGGTTPALTSSLIVDDVYIDTTGQNLSNPVPEPSSAVLLGAAATLGLISRRRNRRS